MRHNKKFNHLGRQSAHRKSMLSNMACSLITHKRIETTTAKAKALKVFVEPLITRSKEDTTHSRRIVFSYLKDKGAVTELFRVVSPKVADRPGGYTRILKTGFRLGDAAEMCFIELVDFNDTYVAGAAPAKGKTRRSRGGSKPAAPAAQAQGAEAAAAAVEPAAPDTVEKAEEKKAPAKKPAAAKKPLVAKTAVPKVSGSKKVAAKSTTTKKG